MRKVVLYGSMNKSDQAISTKSLALVMPDLQPTNTMAVPYGNGNKAFSEYFVLGPAASGYSSVKGGEAGFASFLVDLAGYREATNRPIEARSSFQTEPLYHSERGQAHPLPNHSKMLDDMRLSLNWQGGKIRILLGFFQIPLPHWRVCSVLHK